MSEDDAVKLVLNSRPLGVNNVILRSWATKARPGSLSLGRDRVGWIVSVKLDIPMDPSVFSFEVYEPDGEVIGIPTM